MPPTIDDRLRELAEATHNQLDPSPDLLRRIRATTGGHSRFHARAAGLLGAAAAAAVLVVALVVAQSGGHHQPERATTSTGPKPSNGLPQLYWRDPTGIGSANLDGTNVVPQLIPFTSSGSVPDPCSVAVDANHVYWATGTGTVARANRDGTGLDTSLVTAPAAVDCVAVDSAHIYWASTRLGTIGRANLDGTGVQDLVASGINQVCGVAVDASHIYWANPTRGAIGRANLDGTGVSGNFITGVHISQPPGGSPVCGLVVDSAHIYWGTTDGIGRANLDGTGVNNGFIGGQDLLGSYVVVCGHDDTYLYWTSVVIGPYNAWIGRAKLSGGGVNADFIPGLRNVSGCAVGP